MISRTEVSTRGPPSLPHPAYLELQQECNQGLMVYAKHLGCILWNLFKVVTRKQPWSDALAQELSCSMAGWASMGSLRWNIS